MNPWVILRRCRTAVLASALILAANVASAAETEVTIMHYFTADIGGAGLHPIFDKFKKETGITVVDSPIGHEDYKTGILVRAAGNSLPDIFSEWAGARTQFVVDTGKLEPLDALWAAQKLDSVVAKPVAASATIYNGKRYLIPIGYHYAAVFYNAKVLKNAGVTTTPKTWDEFVSMCKTLKARASLRSHSERRIAGRGNSGSTTFCCAPPAPSTGRNSSPVRRPIPIQRSRRRWRCGKTSSMPGSSAIIPTPTIGPTLRTRSPKAKRR